jgi:TolA-binding protein
MRTKSCLLLFATISALPAAAQQPVSTERRVDRLEQEMRAVQRRVFPNGAQGVSGGPATVDPEITPVTRPLPGPGTGGDGLSGLTGRIEALEAQLQRVTGQVEENGYRLRQLEEQARQMRSDIEARMARLEQPPTATPAPAGGEPTTDDPGATTPSGDPAVATPVAPPAGDPAQAAYNAGYRLWEQRRYAEAQTALTAAGEQYSSSRWASWSRNLAGRAYLDDNKPATAARIFLANYQGNPRGERAADSLYFLGEALVRLNRPREACPVYEELTTNFPNMRDWLRQRLPAARRAAGCR